MRYSIVLHTLNLTVRPDRRSRWMIKLCLSSTMTRFAMVKLRDRMSELDCDH